jgi:acetyl-CoA carboxylase carboxyltransferase component
LNIFIYINKNIMATKRISLNELRRLVKQIINEEISEDQKSWSDKKSKMYDAYVNAHNELEDLKDELKRSKNRKDEEDVKRINIRIRNLEFAKKTSKEKFDEL